MGLRIRLRPQERIVINGCVVTNGDRRNTITVSSFGQVLRGKDIIQPQDAVTPLQKLYFAIQMMLINSNTDIDAEKDALRHVNRLGAVAFVSLTTDEDRARLLTAMEKTHQGDYYKALAELRPITGDDKEKPNTNAFPVDLSEADQRFRDAAKEHFRRLDQEQQACSQ
ncbi:flagellar biosynthesis repressor FlbT [Hyphococcus sp.]|jgi:flagellar protein FlbT|uniref:flagellar biosynthesis repressor FlbT n=1 Tax=Hyphococcus sp. TaxID=2038636 RepID=UPI003D0EA543